MRHLTFAPLALVWLWGCLPGSGSSSSSSSGSVSTSSTSSSSSSGGGAQSGRADAGAARSDGGGPDGGPAISLLSGRVLSPNGSFGVFDALVSIDLITDGGTPLHRSTYTRHDGRYQVNGLPAGTFTLTAERLHFHGATTATLPSATAQLNNADIHVVASGVRYAVVTGDYDHIEDIVGPAGLGFTATMVPGRTGTAWLTTITEPAFLQNYDAIFLNCGVYDDPFFDAEVDAGVADLEVRRQRLRDFVESGKSLYISDWAYHIMEWLYPEAITFVGDDGVRDSAKLGRAEEVVGIISDETLRKIVGQTVLIEYDLGAWVMVDSVTALTDGGVRARELVKGTVHSTTGVEYVDHPLAIRVEAGAGRIIFTTFHNEVQLDQSVREILQYMVLSL